MSQATFIDIPTDSLVSVLVKAGFNEITNSLPASRYGHVQERVFARDHHKISNVQIRVYTSIDIRTNKVRDVDEDRIMICAVYTEGTKVGHDRKAKGRFLFGAKGVNRSSGETDHETAVKAILDRMLSRMRSVYGDVNKAPKCPVCGEPVKTAKSRKRWIRRTHRKSVRKANPNFGRAYKACMSEGCSFFEWTEEPKAEKTPKSIEGKILDGRPAGAVAKSNPPVVAVDPLDKPPVTVPDPSISTIGLARDLADAYDEHLNEPPPPEPDFESNPASVSCPDRWIPSDDEAEALAKAEYKENELESASLDDARAMFSR
jgi:hypothetical protein